MPHRLDKPLDGAQLCAQVMHRHGLGLRALARRCGVSPATAKAWIDGRAQPTDSHGLTLAALADLHPDLVLIGLAEARTDCPDGRALWRRMFACVCRTIQGDTETMRESDGLLT